MADQVLHFFRSLKEVHITSQFNAVAHEIALLLEIEFHIANKLALLVNGLVWTNLSNPLCVLEDCLQNLVRILDALFGQLNRHREVGEESKLRIDRSCDIDCQIFLL